LTVNLPAMPRKARHAPGGLIYHVLNRAAGRATLFRGRRDFEAFQGCLARAVEAEPIRVLAYCVMSNHWHLVLWPERDGQLARFMLRLTVAHSRRWLIHRGQIGTGHLYQGRYKSFAIQDGPHLSTVCRYVERNPVRAGAAKRSRDWAWGSAGQADLAAELRLPLEKHPHLARPDWRAWVDRPQTAAEEAALLRCIREGRPFGEDKWLKTMEKALGWREPLKRGRPRKAASRPGK
jgi:putative transposase